MNKKMIVATVVLALICIGGIVAFVLMKQTTADGAIAKIIVDGQTVRAVPLSQDLTFDIDTGHGHNEIEVKDGCISVIAADCPDKVCVSTGATNSSVVPIICLPHRLEIRIISADEAKIDAEIR